MDFAAIKALQLSAVVSQSVKLKRSSNEWVGCCPFHPDRTPSFTVNDAKGFAHCFGCGWHGDAADFVGKLHGVGLREAAEMLGANRLPTVVHSPLPPEPERDTRNEALAIWRSSAPVRGTPAEAYLRSRGIHVSIRESIRFARLHYGKRGGLHPCLVALVAGADNKVAGIQRTYLKEDGSGKADLPKPKLSLGSVAGGAIRLAPCAAVLTVCEGLEDGLTLQQEIGQAVWVATGASMVPSMRFPQGVRSVVIGADADEAGERSARAAAEAFALEGREVRIIRPLPGHKDFNAELMGRGE
ncbi:MAG: DUF7146 domain-containing protein [Sphingomicrobium sp.]